jgi:putative membrane protein
VYAVVLRFVGIDSAHPWLLIAFMAAVSMTFVMILHALAAGLGAPGKFLGLVFMVLQLVSAGGTFPWQTLPEPLHPLHHVLPMSYAVDGIRRLMYGGSLEGIWLDLAVLAAYLVGAFVLSSLAARRAGTWNALRIKPELAI